MTREEAINLLEEKGQSHVMRGFDDLTEEQQNVVFAEQPVVCLVFHDVFPFMAQ